MNNRHAVGIALAAVVALAAGSGSAWAAGNNCTRVGTWFGAADNDLTWLGTDTPGTSATGGQMNLVTRFTSGVGVWEKCHLGWWYWQTRS